MNPKKTIKVSLETWRRIITIKTALGIKSADAVIARFLKE